MFDTNFAFHHPRSLSLESNETASTHEPFRSVSPCSPISAFPPPRCSVADLAACFANSRLRQDAQICYDPCSSYANTEDDDASWAIPRHEANDLAPLSHLTTFPPRSYPPSRRLQRQVSTRMLCSGSHHKDIAALVSSMIQAQTQCSTVLSSTELNNGDEEDEGYTSSDAQASRRSSVAIAKSPLEYRRSSALKTVGASVSKAVRFRKENKSRRIRSVESDSR